MSHPGYYHGYWGGGGRYGWGGGYGYGGYGGWHRPLAWGLGGWGLGSLYYGSGYLNYSNPYYNSGLSNNVYNYSQPIPVPYNTPNMTAPSSAVSNPPTATPSVANATDDLLNSAVAHFKQREYDQALDIINGGISQHADDAVFHEFRALVLFAKGDYQQAAATIHSVLAVGPGWNWTTLNSFYPDIGIYTNQLHALEAFTNQNPKDSASRFLLAYHYMTEGYPDAAAKQLQQVVALGPNDRVAADLLRMASSEQTASSEEQTANGQSAPTQANAKPIDPSTIIGSWNATRSDGSNFSLTLTADQKFKWGYTAKQKPPQTFEGNYKLDGNVIELERSAGGALVAQLNPTDKAGFNFKMVGAPDDDPGLTFVQ